ncbi:MAG: cytochrome c biogenesis protein CcdA [Armatimonadota bacterium]|nr:thioredoxin family protein [Armatimonadota bacterium]MCX7777136.1 thioredoxin family protein [Armatimonadota bacterium]MDW8025183.1 cytochrome c biogenesis protein CcdA [Armatimonadota bacterium]
MPRKRRDMFGVMNCLSSLSSVGIGICIVLISLVCPPTNLSYGAQPEVKAEAHMDTSAIRRNGKVNIMVLVRLPKGLHVNSHKPKEKWLIPTTLSLKLPSWLKVERTYYPPAKVLHTSFGELLVYEGEFAIVTTLIASRDAPLGVHRIFADLRYQACDERRCYPPSSLRLPITVIVVSEGAKVKPTNSDLFRRYASHLKLPPEVEQKESTSIIGVGASERISSLIRRFGWTAALLIIFAFGVALNLTPCVFPLVPITIGYFASRSHGSVSRLATEALLYVLGIAITYSLMGVAAGLTGGLFGSALQHPAALVIVASIIAIFALCMFGAYEIELPSRLLGRLHNFAQAVGPFGLGMVAGFIAAPCVAPFTAALLAFVAASRSAAIGFLCFFALSLGLGLPYIFLALFSGSLHRLPKSGIWMDWVKKALGFALLALSIYLIIPLLPHLVAPFALPSLLLIAGIHLGWFVSPRDEQGRFFAFKRVVGGLMVMAAIGLLMHSSYTVGYERGYDAALSASAKKDDYLIWKDYSARLFKEALKTGKPVLIKFTAKWCPECKKLERQTLSHNDVLKELKKITCLRVDLTFKNSVSEGLRKRYGVLGLPTLIFIGSDGEELHHLRVEGFVDKDELLNRLLQLR